MTGTCATKWPDYPAADLLMPSHALGDDEAMAITRLVAENQFLRATLQQQHQHCQALSLAMESLRQAALTDPLTGLLNRRALDQQVDELRDGEKPCVLSVLMLDIDHFKRINDRHGHVRGDALLRQVAETLRHSIRAEDRVFRYGGEEFLVLLCGVPLMHAIAVAESIRQRIERLQLADRDAGVMSCTASLGVASLQQHDDPDSLFERVDRALYQAKSWGRNRVVHENLLN